MSQRRKFRLYIALALFVAYPALLIYGPTAVQRLVPPACLVTTIALLFWRFPSRLPGLLQISDLRLRPGSVCRIRRLADLWSYARGAAHGRPGVRISHVRVALLAEIPPFETAQILA
jgi:hypothetical protein